MKKTGRRDLKRAALFCGILVGAPSITHGEQLPARIGLVCATQRAIPRDVQALIKPLVAAYRGRGVADYGDRAAILNFGQPPTDVFFIPLSCGATGNCWWCVVASAPSRNLGVLSGAVIRVAQGPGWPAIEAFTHAGAGEGDLETLVQRGGQYHRQSIAELTPDAANSFLACVDNEACCPTTSNLTAP